MLSYCSASGAWWLLALVRHAKHPTPPPSPEGDGSSEGGQEDPALDGSRGSGAGEDEEQGVGGRSAAPSGVDSSLTQPLLEPGMERDEAAPAALGTLEPAVLDEGAPASPEAAALDASNPLGDGGAPERPPSPFAAPELQAQLPPELSPMQCLRSGDFWLLFVVIAIGMGSG